ncbi:MAG: hypothetical protein HN368_12720 [Spirochaetales bacterium]|jgi:hypothetical protein|nr:hypothetical protein [Spirochaetales bacterium]
MSAKQVREVFLKTRRNIFLLFASGILFSCTGDPPEIRQVFWQLNAVHNRETENKQESLSVFLHVADADGTEDMDLMYILQDQNELLWEMTTEGWQEFKNGEETWIGSNNIQMDDGSPFPRDLFRVIVIDRSGERSRDEFYINSDPIELDSVVFPESNFADGMIQLSGNFPEYTLWFYDEDHNGIKVFTTNQSALPLSSALDSREIQIGSYYYVNSELGASGYGLIYGPVYLEQ